MRSMLAGALAAATIWAAGSAQAEWRAAPARLRAATLARRTPRSATRPGWLAIRLVDAGVAGDSRRWAQTWAGAATLGTALGWLGGGPVTAALGIGIGIGGPWLALCSRRGRGAAAVEAALPSVLEATARGLRAGASLPVALAAAAAGATPAVAHDLAGVASQAGRTGLAAALDGWAAERPLPGCLLYTSPSPRDS